MPKAIVHFSQSFFGRAGIILGGSIGGQGIAILMLPIISRIYSAETIGIAGTVLAIVSISSLVVCFQYDQAVVVAHSAQLPYLLILSSSIAFLWCMFISALLLVDLYGVWFWPAHILASWYINWTLPVLVLVYGLFVLLISLNLRLNELRKVSVGRILYYGGGSLLQVVMGSFIRSSETVFLIGQAVGALMGVIYLFPYRRTHIWLQNPPDLKVLSVQLSQVARFYIKFPKFQMGAGFTNAASIYLPVVFMRVAFSDTWAGWYYMAWRLVSAPVTLLSQAIGQVFYRDSAERERDGTLEGRLVENIVSKLLRLTVLPTIFFIILAPAVIPSILGKQWTSVSLLVQILLIAAGITFITSPISMLLNIRGLQSGALGYSVLLLVGRTAGLYLGWCLMTPTASVWGYSILTALVMLLFLNYIIRSFHGRLITVIKYAKSSLVDTSIILLIILCLWYTDLLYESYIIGIIICLFCFAFWREFHREFGNLIGR